MATRTFVFFMSVLCASGVRALQVTPNSPCSAACVDSDTLDLSDPNSSNTVNSDITCQDAAYATSNAGIKWQNCMTCLQNSTFSQGSESDQMWFLYNSRYALSYCLFGYPNATSVGNSPCITSSACGPLEGAVKQGVPRPSGAPYGYCSVDDGAITGPNYNKCLSCISAAGDTQYTSNYLVALEAGCLQQPAPGKTIGLNGTVFSPTIIGIVDPTALASQPKSSPGLPSTTIAGIVACILILILAAAAFLFVRHRKRKNRLARASPRTEHIWSNSGPRPPSKLSFQCQAHMSPRSAKFFPDEEDLIEDKYETRGSPIVSRKTQTWTPAQSTVSTFPDFSPISELDKETGRKQRHYPVTSVVPLHSLDTSALPAAPAPTHASPLTSSAGGGGVTRFSPFETFTSPSSTTSTRSTANLLPKVAPYVPANWVGGAHHAAIGYASTTNQATVAAPGTGTGTGTTPTLRQTPIWSSPSPPPPPPPSKSPRMMPGKWGGGGKGGDRESGSPVETKVIGTVFPPPPPRRR